MIKLLRAYRELTKTCGDCPPSTSVHVTHHIDTGSATPILLRRRRQVHNEDEVIEEHILNAVVIEEGNGAWCFPVVLVKKKDGEIRFCVDYRALNRLTKRDVYPLPSIDETIETLGGVQLFTALDLKAGYWQILVNEEDKDKTAFTTKRGLYRFVRMPFGLTNAPSTFQRLMNNVLRGLTWITCLVYLDDIVIFTRGGIGRHIVEVACVFERLASAGLTLKLKKCAFATRPMEYLGHELSCDGVRPLSRLIAAAEDFPRPTDAVEAKRFIHLAGYYRRFAEGFGAIMAPTPMTKLLRKGAEWQWTEPQESAFEQVKQILTTKPVLVYPDFRLPFRLVTDASTIGLGACLIQQYEGGWKLISYASKVTSVTEAKYGITELECLAVVWSITLFRPYLYERTFPITTDHAVLKWLLSSPNLTGKLHRWALILTNVVADALSRAPVRGLAAVGRRKLAQQRRRARHDAMRVVSEANEGSATMVADSSECPVTTVATRSDHVENAAAEDPAMNGGVMPKNEAVFPLMTTENVVPDVTAMSNAVPNSMTTATANRSLTAAEDDATERLTTRDAVTMRLEQATTSGELEPRNTATGVTSHLKTSPGLSRPLTRVAKRRANEARRLAERLGKASTPTTSGSEQNVRIARKRGGLHRKTVVTASRSTVGPIRGPDGVGVRWREPLCNELGTRRDGSSPDHEHQQLGLEYHNAENVAAFLMKFVVLRLGPFRALLTDGEPELTGRAIEKLVELLQAHQTNPVPYRPQMIGLVERFHSIWKDCVAIYIQTEAQNDWDAWVDFALYLYNSGRHTAVSISPNELMLGRKLRTPNVYNSGRHTTVSLSPNELMLGRKLRTRTSCYGARASRMQAP
ncbi:LOW QUALITY PROTEIN: Retrovirus Polyprotein [Phytophthora megakarya]|uniref:Retrovirus Polyprotein n=1 Tax=Phytophthora megakarya TaxID=4795 RepID=A0A225WHY3_9STRA|nr:LOW QUALITY PROTEIN: Retrovirus Polyprotein [Phytophthora megakarya]OWZ16709.1 LOW QUALITY PROTEIN: Retrovirus Polyprotein [Phytophthora megakarya]